MKAFQCNSSWRCLLPSLVTVFTVLWIVLVAASNVQIPKQKLPTSSSRLATRGAGVAIEAHAPVFSVAAGFTANDVHRHTTHFDDATERVVQWQTASNVERSLTATSRGQQTTGVPRLTRDTIVIFDSLGEFTVEHGAAIRQLVGDDVEIIVKVPLSSPLGRSSRVGGDGSFVPNAAMSGQWMMQDTLHMLLEHQRLNNRNIFSKNGTDDAFGAPPNHSPSALSDPLVIVFDFRRADLRCASPFEQLRLHFQALRNNQQQQQRRQKQSPLLLHDVVYLATPPVRDPLDVSEVVTNFHRTSALWKMSFQWRTKLHREQKTTRQEKQQHEPQEGAVEDHSFPSATSSPPPLDDDDYIHQAPSMLPELHHILYFGLDSWRQDGASQGLFYFPSAEKTPSPDQLISSAFYAGTSTSLLEFLSAVCAVIGCTDCDVDTSLPLEPILTHLYISWASGGTVPRTMQRDSLLLTSIRTFPCAQRKSVDPLQCGQQHKKQSSSFLVIDTTPDCMAERASLHKKGLFRSLKRMEVVATTTGVQQSLSPQLSSAVQPLLPACVAQYQLSGHPAHHGVARLRVDVDDKESMKALKSMKSHTWDHTNRILDIWGNWRRGGYWIPHHSLRPAVSSVQKYGNLLPRFPATACPAGELGSESTVIITMATKYHPRRVSEFVHTFLRTQEQLRGCASGGNGTQFPTVLVAVVSDPADYVEELLRPGMWRGSGRPPPVVFLSLSVWKKLGSKKYPSPLKKCKVVISRFPTLMLLLRVIETEWKPTYAMMSDSRDVLFQTNVGEAIAEINALRTNGELPVELPVVYGSVPLISRDREVRHRSRDSVRRPNSQNTGDEQRPCDNATGASPAATTKDNFVGIVLERGYLNSPDLFGLTPYVFNRLWLAQTFGDAFGWRVTETSELRFQQRSSSHCKSEENQKHSRIQGGIPFPIACAGVLIGSITGVIDTVRLLTDTLLHTTKCKGNDQGVLVALAVMGFARSGFPHDVLLLDPYYGKFTHGFTDDAGRNMRWDEPQQHDAASSERLSHARGGGKLVTNCHGMPYAVLHQIDRHDGPYEYLVSSINATLPRS